MKCLKLVSFTIALGLVLSATAAWPQTDRFSAQFDDTPLGQVLASFQRLDPTLQYVLAPDLAGIKVTAVLVDMTPAAALKVVLVQCGLTAAEEAGVYQIRRQSPAPGPRAPQPAARRVPPVFMARPAESVAISGAAPPAAAPGTAAAPGKAGTAATEEEAPPLRLIMVRYADPTDLAWLFGGDVVEGGGLYGTSGDSGGSGSSGYGGSYGNSDSSGSSRRGSSGNSGSGTSRGGSRGSSSYSGSSSRRGSSY